VAFRFARDGFIDGGMEQRIVLARPERRAEIGRVLLAETHIKSAGAGDPHRLQASQKLWVIGVMNPSLPPVSRTCT